MEHKTPEELANLKHTIRREVEETLRSAKSEDFTASFEVENPASGSRKTVPDTRREVERDDDFWNLGKPKSRVYKKPDFSDTPVEMTDISHIVEIDCGLSTAELIDRDARPEQMTVTRGIHSRLNYRPVDNTSLLDDVFDELAKEREDPPGTSGLLPGEEPIRPRTTTATTSEGRQTIVHDAPPRYGSYKRQGGFRPKTSAESPEKRKHPASDAVLAVYEPGGYLLRSVEVRSWSADIDFYERFLENAEKSHDTPSSVPYTADYPVCKYFSYVPQYSHMNRGQLECYRWIRENIRHGRYPECDSSYIQLYIYEILNLPERIPPETGAAQLAGIWLAYRKTEPRLDGYLCEWLPDYCMIHGCPMPKEVKTILPEIVPKAQFKEFFCDLHPDTATAEDYHILAKTLIETSSDYDYRRSRYYSDHRDAYEKQLPEAVAAVIERAIRSGSGVFAREKTYKMSRDSYCGAIVSIDVKRRMNVEFCSFTRSADTRKAVTAIVKYAENKLRMTLGIKAKLGVDGIDPADSAFLDAYFAPQLPQKLTKSKEDRYMPEDYLKNYESEDSGFDFGAAAEIERLSWQNTTRLTGVGSADEQSSVQPLSEGEEIPRWESSVAEAKPEEEPAEEPIPVSVSEQISAEEEPAEVPAVSETADPSDDDALLRDAMSAALAGNFHDFCRDHQIYDGVLADRINTIFLDLIGDIVLEENGRSYTIIEDYREDIDSWMEER